MRLRHTFGCLLLIVIGSSVTARAEDDTMTVVAEGAIPDDIVNVISLPEFVPANATTRSKKGIATADEAKKLGKDFGKQMAAEAKLKNEQVREDLRDKARRDARGNNGRGRGKE